MSPQTFVFIGRSGCGKGTQAGLLIQHIKETMPEKDVFYLETGQKFRDFIASSGYTNDLARKIQEIGGLQPSFLAVWMWSNIFIDELSAEKVLMVDGTPRKLGEAIIFLDSMKFYGRKPYIIYVNVSRKWSEDRLLERHRVDDKKDSVKNRLDWFDTDVMPAVEYFKNNEDCVFLDVNGEQPIEDVKEEIFRKLGMV